MHPFGREEETSRRELFGFFTRCLQRGEWELAAACVPQLGDERGDDPQSPQDIVEAIVTHPYPLRWVKPWQKRTGMLTLVIINHMSLCENIKHIHVPLSVDVAYSWCIMYSIVKPIKVVLNISSSREFKETFKRHICYTQVGNGGQPSQIGLVLASSPGETD